MKYVLIHRLLAALAFLTIAGSVKAGDSRYLILNFDCRGKASGESGSIGNALRGSVIKKGGTLVSRDLFEKAIKQRGFNESDLNYMLDDLKSTAKSLGATGAVYGHVYSHEEMFVIELRYLGYGDDQPILFDPIVCNDKSAIYEIIPEIAAMILSPDKTPPSVVSVDPGEGQQSVEQYIEMKISFSEPMNPATISLEGKPENMWQKFGEVLYNEDSNEFTINVHLYPDIDYEFRINGEQSMGFKDLAGNPARTYSWKFKTGR